MKKILIGSARIIILGLLPVISFSQETVIHKKKYLLFPRHESYQEKEWLNVSQLSFHHFLKQMPSDSALIDSDSSIFKITPERNFRIFTDKAGNRYYWIRATSRPYKVSPEFTSEESAVKDAWNKFAGLYIVDWPYAEDTLVPGSKRYNMLGKRTIDSLVINRAAYRLHSSDTVIIDFVKIHDGITGINTIIHLRSNDKEVLLTGESTVYSTLCRLMRSVLTADNAREGIIRFLESSGRGSSIKNNKYFILPLLAEIAADAIQRIPKFKPYPVLEDYQQIHKGTKPKVITYGSD